MKILFVTPHFPWAGVTGGLSLVYHKIARLADRGHRVGLVSFIREDEKVDPMDPVFCRLRECHTISRPPQASLPVQLFHRAYSRVPSYFRQYWSEAMSRKIGDVVHEGNYDLVIAEFTGMGHHLVRNPYLPAVRKIISSHFNVAKSTQSAALALGWKSPHAWRLRTSIQRLLRQELKFYRGVDRVLVMTAHERYQLLEEDPSLRVNVIPCGVDADYFRPDPAVEPEEALVFTAFYVVESNVDAVKWFVAKCWPILKKRRPNLKFYVVGAGAPESIVALGRKDPSIIVTGAVDDVRPYLHRAKVYVCPIRQSSGLRFKLFEVMASGTPLVSTTLGGEGIPLQNGDNCFLADQMDIMAQCIDLLLDDEPLRQSIARQARELAATRFAWNHAIDLLEATMNDVMNH
jgi:polysaccharide biosynthesis protein PslH